MKDKRHKVFSADFRLELFFAAAPHDAVQRGPQLQQAAAQLVGKPGMRSASASSLPHPTPMARLASDRRPGGGRAASVEAEGGSDGAHSDSEDAAVDWALHGSVWHMRAFSDSELCRDSALARLFDEHTAGIEAAAASARAAESARAADARDGLMPDSRALPAPTRRRAATVTAAGGMATHLESSRVRPRGVPAAVAGPSRGVDSAASHPSHRRPAGSTWLVGLLAARAMRRMRLRERAAGATLPATTAAQAPAAADAGVAVDDAPADAAAAAADAAAAAGAAATAASVSTESEWV